MLNTVDWKHWLTASRKRAAGNRRDMTKQESFLMFAAEPKPPCPDEYIGKFYVVDNMPGVWIPIPVGDGNYAAYAYLWSEVQAK